MDLREKKTKRNIKNAFLQLRAHKPLERITIKELAESAEISKATFYLHYKDIYDLSNQLQHEVIQNILDSIVKPNISLWKMEHISWILSEAFRAYQSVIDLLFSGQQSSVLPLSLAQGIRECVLRTNPDFFDDMKQNVLLSYQVYGAYYAYQENYKRFGNKPVLDVLDEITANISMAAKLFPNVE